MKNFKVEVIRGKEKIGENLIEVKSPQAKILLECGVALKPTEKTKKLEKKVLRTFYDAIIVSHYHLDHAGLLKYPLKTNAIYMGKDTYKILEISGNICEENKGKVQFFKSRQAFEIKDVVVKPFLCDHSAYDSYMIALYQGEEKILYTGDFRANGRKNFDSLLKSLPKKVDLLICEGTLSSERNQTEQELEEKMVETFKKYKHVFILKSSQNFDRDVTIYRAAKRTGKTYIQHLSTANVAKELGNIPNPISFDDCYTYLPRAVSESKHKKIKETYKDKLLSRSQIIKMDNFVMQITSSMKGYLKKVKDEGRWFDSVAIFSMWEGYKKEMYDILSLFDRGDSAVVITNGMVSALSDVDGIIYACRHTHDANNSTSLFSEMHDLDYSNRQSTALMFMSVDKFTMFERPMSQMKNDGLNVIDLHTSGHADKQSIKKLMYSVSPKEIIYVHTNKKGENTDGLQ